MNLVMIVPKVCAELFLLSLGLVHLLMLLGLGELSQPWMNMSVLVLFALVWF